MREAAQAGAKRALTALLRPFGLKLVRLEPPQDPAHRADLDPWLHSSHHPLPDDARERLRADHPRLLALRQEYSTLDWPVCTHSRWQADSVRGWLNLLYFRGESIVVWHYRESDQQSRLLYFLFLRYVLERDRTGLVKSLGENGAFGCWTYEFPGYPPCSRDLLDSVNEILFLDRRLSVLSASGLRVLDIGAGYGRLGHRVAQAIPGLSDYCCVDAVPEMTFLSEYYVEYREVAPPVRVVALPNVVDLPIDGFDLAINVHSFSEMPLAAIDWWMGQLERMRVQNFFLVPNEPDGFLSTEVDGSRLDYGPVIESHGYHLATEEAVFDDEALRDLTGVQDRFCLFEHTGG